MATRTIRTIGDDVLTKVCKEVKEVTPKTKELIDDMFETMYDAMGVGLGSKPGRHAEKNRSYRLRG